MKISSIGHVYMQSQAKALNEKQKDVKVATFQQNEFSPALLLSANMNRVSFGDKSDEFYCPYEEDVPPNKKPCDNQTRKLVDYPEGKDGFYDEDCSGAHRIKVQSPKEKNPDIVFKDQIKNLCESDMPGAENLANELLEQMFKTNPFVATRVVKRALREAHDTDVRFFDDISQEVHILHSIKSPEEATIQSKYI